MSEELNNSNGNSASKMNPSHIAFTKCLRAYSPQPRQQFYQPRRSRQTGRSVGQMMSASSQESEQSAEDLIGQTEVPKYFRDCYQRIRTQKNEIIHEMDQMLNGPTGYLNQHIIIEISHIRSNTALGGFLLRDKHFWAVFLLYMEEIRQTSNSALIRVLYDNMHNKFLQDFCRRDVQEVLQLINKQNSIVSIREEDEPNSDIKPTKQNFIRQRCDLKFNTQTKDTKQEQLSFNLSLSKIPDDKSFNSYKSLNHFKQEDMNINKHLERPTPRFVPKDEYISILSSKIPQAKLEQQCISNDESIVESQSHKVELVPKIGLISSPKVEILLPIPGPLSDCTSVENKKNFVTQASIEPKQEQESESNKYLITEPASKGQQLSDEGSFTHQEEQKKLKEKQLHEQQRLKLEQEVLQIVEQHAAKYQSEQPVANSPIQATRKSARIVQIILYQKQGNTNSNQRKQSIEYPTGMEPKKRLKKKSSIITPWRVIVRENDIQEDYYGIKVEIERVVQGNSLYDIVVLSEATMNIFGMENKYQRFALCQKRAMASTEVELVRVSLQQYIEYTEKLGQLTRILCFQEGKTTN